MHKTQHLDGSIPNSGKAVAMEEEKMTCFDENVEIKNKCPADHPWIDQSINHWLVFLLYEYLYCIPGICVQLNWCQSCRFDCFNVSSPPRCHQLFAAKCLHWSRTEVADSKRELFTEKPALSKSEQFRWNLVQRCKQRPLAPFKSKSSNTKAPQRSWQVVTGWWFDCANFSCEAFDKPVESGTSPAMACLLSSQKKIHKMQNFACNIIQKFTKMQKIARMEEAQVNLPYGSRFQISPVF